jgi:hypothetical protein
MGTRQLDEIRKPKTVSAPCVTSNYFPTTLDALNTPLPSDRIYDDINRLPLIRGERKTRDKSIGFLSKDGKESVWMENRYKLIATPEKARMAKELTAWKAGVMLELNAAAK